MAIKGAQCAIYFNLDFDILADFLDMETDEVERLWDNGELEETIAENLTVNEILEVVDIDIYGGINVGSGYF